MKAHDVSLDDVARIEEIRKTIGEKGLLKKFYEDAYSRYRECLNRCPNEGIALEIGSGGGFVKEHIPEMTTSDILAYEGLDRVVDARKLPFEDNSLRGIFMCNVFHHIPSATAFLQEAQRCLKPGGRIFMVEPHPGWISTPVFKYIHHEPYLPDQKDWDFESKGPLSDANGALPWIVFKRDRDKFKAQFPQLKLERYQPTSPLCYWISGGLKRWTLLPGWAFPVVSLFDKALIQVNEQFGSFVDIEVVKTA